MVVTPALGRFAWREMTSRPPDFVLRRDNSTDVHNVAPNAEVGAEAGAEIGDVYLRRWWVIPRNPVFNIYVHEFLGSDDDRAFHDHPWWSFSWCLAGTLCEYSYATPPRAADAVPLVRRRAVLPGVRILRRARHAHRLELISSAAVTLFITGPRLRVWGFWDVVNWPASSLREGRRLRFVRWFDWDPDGAGDDAQGGA